MSKMVTLRDFAKAKALDSHSLFCRLIRNIGVGRLVFRIRVVLCKVDNLLGRYNQRFIEYPWVLQKLGPGKGRLVLDVGCSGSLLDHELLARGFRVVGLDFNDHTMRNSREAFVQANVVNTDLPSEIFDVIVSVSTIEHIGLDTYSQDLLLEDGDFSAMRELSRLLKPRGILLLTFPYDGRGPFRIFRFGKKRDFLERRYDQNRLSRLLNGFMILDSAFFLCLLKNRCKFIPIQKSVLDELSTKISDGSLGCLILQKRASNGMTK
jgi:SAM-dependent methyltransferase